MIMTACNAHASNPEVTSLSPAEYNAALKADSAAYLLDVRRPEEFDAGHIAGARNLNWLDTEAFRRRSVDIDKARTVYLYCRSGVRSADAADYLAREGYDVVNLSGGILGWEETSLPVEVISDGARQLEAQGITHDSFTTPGGLKVNIHFIRHASLIIEVGGRWIYVDPTGMFGHDFSRLPKADAVMVTHEHRDHYDPRTIDAVSTPTTRLIAGGRVAGLAGKGEAVAPGDTLQIAGIKVTATPAFNITGDHLQYHPRERRDVGFILDVDGLRIYIAGDTEDIPEMASIKDVDIAFLPVNQPFTMTQEQAVHAIRMLSPGIVYPYHYGETLLTPVIEAFAAPGAPEIRIRPLQ